MVTTRTGMVLGLMVAAAAGCGDDGEEGATASDRPARAEQPPPKTVTVRTDPARVTAFSPKRLALRAGTYRVVLDNRGGKQHSLRIQKGRRCCFKGPDVGGTETTSRPGKISGTARLAPGEHVFLCTAHWRQGMTGRLTVTG